MVEAVINRPSLLDSGAGTRESVLYYITYEGRQVTFSHLPSSFP